MLCFKADDSQFDSSTLDNYSSAIFFGGAVISKDDNWQVAGTIKTVESIYC